MCLVWCSVGVPRLSAAQIDGKLLDGLDGLLKYVNCDCVCKFNLRIRRWFTIVAVEEPRAEAWRCPSGVQLMNYGWSI